MNSLEAVGRLLQRVNTIAHATVLATGKNTSLLGMLEVEVLIQMIEIEM